MRLLYIPASYYTTGARNTKPLLPVGLLIEIIIANENIENIFFMYPASYQNEQLKLIH